MQRPLFIFSFFLVHPSISSLTLGQQWTVMHFKDFLLGLEAFSWGGTMRLRDAGTPGLARAWVQDAARQTILSTYADVYCKR